MISKLCSVLTLIFLYKKNLFVMRVTIIREAFFLLSVPTLMLIDHPTKYCS